MKKAIWISILIVVLGLTGFVYFKFYFEFGEGVKAGELNYMVRKGIIFKTYEGKLIISIDNKKPIPPTVLPNN